MIQEWIKLESMKVLVTCDNDCTQEQKLELAKQIIVEWARLGYQHDIRIKPLPIIWTVEDEARWKNQ